jgi:NADH-quinone oxidoreductase subunit M
MPASYLLTVLTFVPLAGTIALFMLRADDHQWIRRIALAVSLFEFALSLRLLHGFALNSADYQFVELHNWIPAPPIHYHLGVDGISLFLVLLPGNRSSTACVVSLSLSWCSKLA